ARSGTARRRSRACVSTMPRTRVPALSLPQYMYPHGGFRLSDAVAIRVGGATRLSRRNSSEFFHRATLGRRRRRRSLDLCSPHLRRRRGASLTAPLPSAWLTKAPLEFAQDFIGMDGVMAQQHQRVEPQVSHLVDNLRLCTVLGR